MNRGSSRRLMLAPNRRCVSAMVRSPVGRLARRHLAGGVLHGLDDVVVPGAAAEVPLQPRADLGLGRLWVPLEQLARRQDHPWRAEAALQPVLLPEALLERVQ